jgi:DNA topoisomerase-1
MANRAGELPETTEAEGRASAQAAGLRYSADARPGITRRRAGRGFGYSRPDGTPVHDEVSLARIRALAIPPAWTDVWICADPVGHLQATGRDAKGRKQYRYHARWRAGRDDAKFEGLIDFARVLPRIRKRCEADLARPGLSREKVLAAVVRLLETTLIRVGNDEYARLNRSFGLTTLRTRHATVTGTRVRFRFRGKSGRQHEVGLRDRRLASVVRRCQDLPGQELFQYLGDDGEPHDVASDDVNAYLREVSGADVTAKDFRTWAGTVLAFRALRALDPGGDERAARRNVVEAVRFTSDRLGNTPAVARRSYVHPAVLEAYLEGSLGTALLEAAEEQRDPPTVADPREEAEVVALLRRRLSADRRKTAAAARSGKKGLARSRPG